MNMNTRKKKNEIKMNKIRSKWRRIEYKIEGSGRMKKGYGIMNRRIREKEIEVSVRKNRRIRENE